MVLKEVRKEGVEREGVGFLFTGGNSVWDRDAHSARNPTTLNLP